MNMVAKKKRPTKPGREVLTSVSQPRGIRIELDKQGLNQELDDPVLNLARAREKQSITIKSEEPDARALSKSAADTESSYADYGAKAQRHYKNAGKGKKDHVSEQVDAIRYLARGLNRNAPRGDLTLEFFRKLEAEAEAEAEDLYTYGFIDIHDIEIVPEDWEARINCKNRQYVLPSDADRWRVYYRIRHEERRKDEERKSVGLKRILEIIINA